MIDFTQEEQEMIEAVAQRIIVWAISNQRAGLSLAVQTDELAIAIFKRAIEINQGAPFRVAINKENWHGVWGTKG